LSTLKKIDIPVSLLSNNFSGFGFLIKINKSGGSKMDVIHIDY